MSELDDAWASALAEAQKRARAAGRNDVAQYLSLRSSNNLLRQTGMSWLFEIFINVAGDANRYQAGLQITDEDAHKFQVGNSTMVGRRVTLRKGERTLFVEAGWPRLPSDGFVKGGGLARANIRHRGMKSADVALLLVQSSKGVPVWVTLDADGLRLEDQTVHESFARNQIKILLDDKAPR